MSTENANPSAEATSKVSPDMPHVEAHASAGATGSGTNDIPHDREPGEIRKENNVSKYIKAAIILALAITIMIAGFLLGKRLFAGRPVVLADEIVANFNMSSVGAWFKKIGTTIATGASKAIGWVKGFFTSSTATAAAEAATVAV